jgi:asparagine N-glycosylation enzyme membrane subunit Stt3
VDGGSDTAVAAALLENKSSGCAWNGGTSVSVVEPASGQTYTVLFDRPTPVGILVRVTTTNGNAQNITQAILDYAAGTINGLAGFVVGADVSPFEIAGAIMSEYPGYYISKVEVSLESSVSYSTNAIAIGVNQIAATQASYVTVVIS